MKVTNTAALAAQPAVICMRADERWESEQISARKIHPQPGRQEGRTKKKKKKTFQSATSSLAADDRRPCHSGERKAPKWRSLRRGKQQERKAKLPPARETEKRPLEMEYVHRFSHSLSSGPL